MTVSILDVLATSPSGKSGPTLTLQELGRYLSEHCNTQAEKDRNARHGLRDELYRDGGVKHIKSVIDVIFKDLQVREKRKDFAEHARFNNALKRIVNELSTVYSEPATRLVEDEANNEKYQALLDAVQMDEQALQIGRLVNLHRTLLVGIRVRTLPDGTKEPVVTVVTPTNARVVLHPNDNTLPVGWLIKTCYRSARPLADKAAWTLWTDHEVIDLREDLYPIADTYVEHGLGVNPYVPVTLGPTAEGFWPGEEGEDLVAGHLMILLTNILLLKEEKSATKQTLASGDTSGMARNQALDTEVMGVAPEGTVFTTVDMSMDPELFTKVADHILETVAHNYGIGSGLIKHQGIQSADARELMRVPLRELRKQQQIPLRRWEQKFARVMSIVASKEGLPDMAFEFEGWRIVFGEVQTPLSRKEELEIFLQAREAGVDDTKEFLKRLFPGLTDDQALELMAEHIDVEILRNKLMRPLQQMSGAMGTPNAPNSNSGPNSAAQAEEDEPDPQGKAELQ